VGVFTPENSGELPCSSQVLMLTVTEHTHEY